MKKIIKWTALCLLLISLVTLYDLFQDKILLQDSLIRLHVVGASNDERDQRIKLQVRDAVTDWLEQHLSGLETTEEAREFILGHLDEIENTANQALVLAGVEDRTEVNFGEESFPVRKYDTFSLPSGIYQSLRIKIGAAEGRNWWCVVFPSLCLDVTNEQWKDTAVSAGFDRELTGALLGEREYEIRFFLLDCLGMLENFIISVMN